MSLIAIASPSLVDSSGAMYFTLVLSLVTGFGIAKKIPPRPAALLSAGALLLLSGLMLFRHLAGQQSMPPPSTGWEPRSGENIVFELERLRRAAEAQELRAEQRELEDRRLRELRLRPDSGGFNTTDLRPQPSPPPPSQTPIPVFELPPPKASTTYVLPANLFTDLTTLGQVASAIINALERSGYVDRSFYRTEFDGLVMVTRLERMNEDGTRLAEHERWPTKEPNIEGFGGLVQMLRGLFFLDPGRYRIFVFVVQSAPFPQTPQTATRQTAETWLLNGLNVLPPEIANRPFSGAPCTVLVYEFASDGTEVRVVDSRLTGKQHLEKTGVLPQLAHAN